MFRSALLAFALVLPSACITERSVVERSSDVLASDLQIALQTIDELNARLTVLEAQVGETQETRTLEERVASLTQEGFAGRVDALETWREQAAEPALLDVERRVSDLDGRVDGLVATASGQGERLDMLEVWRVMVDGSLVEHDGRLLVAEGAIIDLIDGGTVLGGRVSTLESWRTATVDPDRTATAAALGELDGRLDDLRTDLGLVVDAFEESEDRWITEDTLWSIGPDGDYETPEEAWDAALRRRISNGAILTLSLLDGEHILDDVWLLNHPDGLSLRVIGNEEDPDAVVVRAASGLDALWISEGHGIQRISGIRLLGDGTGTAVLVDSHAYAGLGTLSIGSFGAGVTAQYGATLIADEGGLVIDGVSTGLGAYHGGITVANGADVTVRSGGSQSAYAYARGHLLANRAIFRNGRRGMLVDMGSFGMLAGGQVRSVSEIGVYVQRGSVAETRAADVRNSGNSNFLSEHFSYLNAREVYSSGAGAWDYFMTSSSLVDARSATGGTRHSIWTTGSFMR